MMYRLVKPLLFIVQPEQAHRHAMKAMDVGVKLLPPALYRGLMQGAKSSPYTCMGLTFQNRVGLAAGFDKNAAHIRALEALGFGFLEIGTVTPLPQVGNPKPRMFRLPDDQALINRMGFNNDGATRIAQRLQRTKRKLPIGGNIGKNKVTPNEDAPSDYLKVFNTLYDHCDYFVVNVSSPNTPGLRSLQETDSLRKILEPLQEANRQGKPLLVKFAPDISDEDVHIMAKLVAEMGLAGIVVSNTTIRRSPLRTDPAIIAAIGAGGLSGPILKQRANDLVKAFRQELPKEASIIGVGGIDSPEDALERIASGADLIQLYTGFVYQGPKLLRNAVRAIHSDSRS